MKEIVTETLIQIALLVVSAAGAVLIRFIKQKTKEIGVKIADERMYVVLEEVDRAVEDAVISVNQVFVNTLKAENLFDEEAQKEALDQAKVGVMQALSKETIEFISATYGDITGWLTTKIEARVNKEKNKNN